MRWRARTLPTTIESVTDHGIHCGDGQTLALVRCEPQDLLEAETWRLTAALRAFGELLRAARTEILFQIQVRRFAGLSADEATFLRNHWNRRLRSESRHARVVFAGVRCRTESSGAALEQLKSALTNMSVTWRPMCRDDYQQYLTSLGIESELADRPSAGRIGETDIAVLTMNGLPGAPVEAGWLAPLLNVEFPCDIGISFRPEETHHAIRLLSRHMRDLAAQNLFDLERGVIQDAYLNGGMEAATQLRDRIARNRGRPLRIGISTVVRADADGPAVAEGIRMVRSRFAATMVQVRTEHFDHMKSAQVCWGLAPPGHQGKLVDSEAAVTCIPWSDSRLTDPDGYVMGYTTANGLPFTIDPFRSPEYANANIGIFAASGQGKSFLIGSMLIEAHRRQREVVVIDPEGEYKHLVRSLGGEWRSLLDGVHINPFCLGDSDDDSVNIVIECCQMLCGMLSPADKAMISKAALGVLAHARTENTMPTMLSLCDRLEADDPMHAAILRRHVQGELKEFLGGEISAPWPSLLAIGYTNVREELVPLTTMLLSFHIWKMVKARRVARHIVFDEAGILAAYPDLKMLLGQLARRCRKYGSSLLVATQNVQDMLRSDDGQVVAANCATVFCGGHRAHEAGLMQKTFGLTEKQRRLVEGAARGQFLVLAGSRRAAVQIDVPEEYRHMITGTKD